jgi:hypothetical protein
LEIVIPEDKSYGSKNLNGTWSGVVGIIASGHAYMGLNVIMFSSEIMDVTDFLNPISTSR